MPGASLMPSAGSSAAAAHIGWCEWLKRCEKSERGTHRFTRLLSVIGQARRGFCQPAPPFCPFADGDPAIGATTRLCYNNLINIYLRQTSLFDGRKFRC